MLYIYFIVIKIIILDTPFKNRNNNNLNDDQTVYDIVLRLYTPPQKS